MPLSTVTVTGSWLAADNTPATGVVIIQPVLPAAGGGFIVAGVAVRVALVAGAISKPVVNNTAATTLQYRITERIDGAVRVTYVVTPTGATLDLSTAPRGTGTATPLYVLSSTLGAASGVATLGSDGILTPAQRPAAGSGSVTSVTAADATVVIGGTPTVAPTVRVGAIAESQVTNLPGDLSTLTTNVAAKATKPILRRAKIANPSDTTLPNTGAGWAVVSGFELAIPAVVGDDVEIDFSAMRTTNTNALLDLAVIVGSTVVRYMATDTSTPAFEGDPGWYTQSGFVCHGGPRGFTVTSGDLDAGNVRFVLACKSNGTGTVFASVNYPFKWRAINRGVVG